MAGLQWCAGLVLLVLLQLAAEAAEENPFLATARDRQLLEAVIDAEMPSFSTPTGVSGITVPHHLLAADLIARGFWAASANSYERVVLVSPDHFRAVQGKFATTRHEIDTVFGALAIDQSATNKLLDHDDLFEELDDIRREHGLLAVAPFIKRFFPEAELVTVLAAISTTEGDWHDAVDALAPIVDERTLIVQSTDFAHYLPLSIAVLRDQESLSVISAHDSAAVAALVQPDHLDSKAAQYIQLALQEEVAGGRPVVIANRNSAEYTPLDSLTTSYVVTVFLRDPAEGARLQYPDQQIIYLAGDTLLGRYFTPFLMAEDSAARITDTVRRLTAGAPLVINLEGVLLDDEVVGVTGPNHAMLAELAGPQMEAFGVVAAGLANNHSHDFGALGFEETRRNLAALGIAPLVNGQVSDLGAFRILPLNFVRGRLTPGHHVAAINDVSFVCDLPADPPLVAFVHWGEEYTDEPRLQELKAAAAMRRCGVTVVVGAHSHVASERVKSIAGGELQLVYSLGNFAFDQSAERSSGALLELRVFAQGTVAGRLVPLPNLFEAARALHVDGAAGGVTP